MNPAIAAAAATVGTRAADKVIDSDLTRKIFNVLLIGAGGFIVYKIGKKTLDNMRKDDAQSRAQEDPNVRVAMGIRNAINPSGTSFMMSFDTTNLNKLWEHTGQITNLSAVQSAYRDLYGSNMMDDLRSELNNEEYQKFMTLATSNNTLVNLVNSGNTTLQVVKYAKPLELIVAKTNLNIRSSPIASYQGKVWEALESNKNIVRTAKKGEFIGFATGRQEFDIKNNVKFIEVGYRIGSLPANLKAMFGKNIGEIRLWVSASSNYVDRFTDATKAITAYPALKNVLAYVLTPTIATPLKGIETRTPTVVSITKAIVLDDSMKPLQSINPNVMLGECVMLLQSNDGNNLVKFRTAQGAERWIKQQNVKIVNI